MKFEPYAFQIYNIHRQITDAAIGDFLDMGLGKTVITLTAVNDLRYNRFLVSKPLVIAPKKVAQGTWSKEAAKWDHLRHLRVQPVLGTEKQRIRALNTPADLYVINRDNVPWLVDYYRNCWPFDMLIIDESTSFKNSDSKRFKHITWIRHMVSRVVLLTGTPSPQGYLDLWAQIYLLDQGQRLGGKFEGYRQRYFEKNPYTHTYAMKPGAEEAIQRLISDICVTMSAKDYLQLPDIVYNDIPVVLDSTAKKHYKELEEKMLLQIDENIIDAGSAMALSNKLLQLCNGAAYDDAGGVVEIHKCKIEAFMELIEELNGQPALVFYNFKHDLTRLEAALSKSGLVVKRLNGPAEENAWNNREIDILLAHPASCAYGLNLQDGGNHVIWFGLNWSLELYQQANKRLHRQGQTQKVIVHHLVVEGGRDEDVVAALGDKSATQDRLIESLKARIEKVKGEAA